MGGVGGILTFMYLAYTCEPERILGTLGGPAAAGLMPSDEEKRNKSLHRQSSYVITKKHEKIIVSLRRKHHFANFPMEFSHGMCIITPET